MPSPDPVASRGFLRGARSVRILIGIVSAIVVAAVVLTAITWPSKPRLSPRRVGDPALLAALGEPEASTRSASRSSTSTNHGRPGTPTSGPRPPRPTRRGR